ncbi:unnamed protein product [Rotaria magnacalcarata]|uniref:Uncharacterized protein n=1 Tax=Rotaria magnacalcarata TaxID=392030 RepID=A0A816ML09_9BILA|nr:unnamed protein product [Rotaria magnacalcarata]
MNQTRSKQSFHYDYIVKHNGSILEQTFVSIEWRNNRERRAAQKSPIYTSNRFDKRYFTNTADHIMTFTRLDLIDGAGSAYVSGQLINRRQQCQLQYGLEAIPFISVTYNKSQTLYEESICSQLKYLKKPYDDFM